jgi:hypothetical protein
MNELSSAVCVCVMLLAHSVPVGARAPRHRNSLPNFTRRNPSRPAEAATAGREPTRQTRS